MRERGQSLIEVLIAVAVGGILVGGSAALIAVILQSGTQNKYFQAASLLGQELMDEVATYAEYDWYCANCAAGNLVGIYNLSRGSGNPYYLTFDSVTDKRFEAMGGADSSVSININSVQYTRYFYVQNVCRGNNGVGLIVNCSPATKEDPSTQKVTVVVSWTDTGGNTRNVRLERYLTRSRNLITRQTDWSGGAVDPPEVVSATADTKKFNTATNIDNTTPGIIKIQGF